MRQVPSCSVHPMLNADPSVNRARGPEERRRRSSGARARLRSAAVAAAFSGLVAAGSAFASETVPVAVSPAGDSGFAVVEARCPTFSWTSVPNREGYELAVYRVTGGDLADGNLTVDEPAALTVRLPGAANSWTPTVERCLQHGERYAWSIRPLGNGKEADWSRPSLFEVAATTASADLTEAVAALRRELVAADAAPRSSGSVVAPASARVPSATSAAAPSTPNVTTFDVDGSGNVVANSFTGSGAALTGVVAATASALAANPGDCSAGNSPLGVTASGAAEGCFDVATQAELNTHKSSTDHDARYALLGHNHSGVYLSTSGGTLSGGLTINGGLKWNCPLVNYPVVGPIQMDRAGTWCVDAVASADAAGGASLNACHNRGMMLCPLEAILTCDSANIGSLALDSCNSRTDGATPHLTRTLGHDGTGSAFGTMLSYSNTNDVQPVAEATVMQYFCCLPISAY